MSWAESRVVVTGAAGRLGSQLLSLLTQKGLQVLGIDRAPANGDIPAVVADLADGDVLRRTLAPNDLLVHTASVHPLSPAVVASREQGDRLYFDLNVAGTWSLYAAAVDSGVAGIVLTSTTGGGGIPPETLDPVSADDRFAPAGIYGISKWFQEGVVDSFARTHGISTVVLRPPPFVESEPLRTGYCLALGGLLLDDVVDAHVAAVEAARAGRVLNEPGVVERFFLAQALPYRQDELALAVKQDRLPLIDRHWTGAEAWFRARGFDPLAGLTWFPSILDIEPAERRLGWRPRATFSRWLAEEGFPGVSP